MSMCYDGVHVYYKMVGIGGAMPWCGVLCVFGGYVFVL